MVLTIEETPSTPAKIYIIHENDKWMEPLRAALEEQKIEYEEWNFGKGGTIDMSVPPPQGVFYNRMSASSHSRGHRYGIEHTHAVLEWLETHERRVINGSRALLLEMSKVRQYAALERAGIRVPKTVVVTGNYDQHDPQAIARLGKIATETFGTIPFISKHNRSGRGLGVRLWNDVSYFLKYLQEDFKREYPVDGIMLLQQYIKSPSPHITRCEFIGGKLLYAVQVNTSDGFELCPADYCSIVQNFKTNFVIQKEWMNPIVKAYMKVLQANDIEICGIEFVEDMEGKIWTYDINTNTNYNPAGEMNAYGGPKAMPAIARFLSRELIKLSIPKPLEKTGSKEEVLEVLLRQECWGWSRLFSALSQTFQKTARHISQ